MVTTGGVRRPHLRLVIATLWFAVAFFGVKGTTATSTAGTTNVANAFSAGSVRLQTTGDGSPTPLVELDGAGPGASTSGCIRVTNAGSIASLVRLYGTDAVDGGLVQHLSVTIERSHASPLTGAYPSCQGFTSAPSTTLYSGPAYGLPGSFDTSALGDATRWAAGESHDYRVTVTLSSSLDAQGKTASARLVWEARSDAS